MNLFKVTVPKHCHVLLLEDSDMRIEWFRKNIPNLHVCKTVEEFIAYFDTKPTVDFIFFDHDLGQEKNGVDAAKWLKERFGGMSAWGLIHSWNRTGAAEMQKILPLVNHFPWGQFDLEIK
jgi:hypothetical protein